jgi:hypothetical protein
MTGWSRSRFAAYSSPVWLRYQDNAVKNAEKAGDYQERQIKAIQILSTISTAIYQARIRAQTEQEQGLQP